MKLQKRAFKPILIRAFVVCGSLVIAWIVVIIFNSQARFWRGERAAMDIKVRQAVLEQLPDGMPENACLPRVFQELSGESFRGNRIIFNSSPPSGDNICLASAERVRIVAYADRPSGIKRLVFLFEQYRESEDPEVGFSWKATPEFLKDEEISWYYQRRLSDLSPEELIIHQQSQIDGPALPPSRGLANDLQRMLQPSVLLLATYIAGGIAFYVWTTPDPQPRRKVTT